MSWFNPFEGGGTGGGGGSSTAYATSLVLSLNTETYVLTATLKNKDGDTLGTPQIIDLPLETMVVSGRYDDNTKKVILVLSNGQEISFSVADLISGLQSEITVNNKLDIELIDCEGSHYKIVWVGTSAEYTAAASSIPENIPVIKTDDDDMDQTPTENSENLVSSGGVYSFVVQGLAGKANSSDLGTAASKDVPASGNASTTQVVMGNDTRLTDSRPASDVSEWAKALTKPSYSYSEINNTPTVDTAPTSGSNNLVSSGGVYTALGDKVDKVSGKQLSTEDYTTAEKTKLGGIEAGANKTVVDSALDGTSTNPVQNGVVKAALDLKANTADLGTAASKDVPVSGNASATQVVLGNDGRLAWMDTNGDIYFGQTRIARLMDYDSYIALATKENIYYMTYPTPTNGRSLSKGGESINENIEDIKEVDEKEEFKETDEPKESEEVKESPMEIKGGEK